MSKCKAVLDSKKITSLAIRHKRNKREKKSARASKRAK
jgi:hypothetical protein